MLAAAATAAGFLFTACSSVTVNKPTLPATDNAKTILFEDFSGPGLDSSRWNVEVTGTRRRLSSGIYLTCFFTCNTR